MDEVAYRAAESAYLRAEGVDATEQWLDLARLGTRIRALVAGEGRTVVLVHGAGIDAACFAPLIARLSRTMRCVALDRPGCGLSPRLPDARRGPGRFEAVADDLLADVADALGVDRIDVVGTSLGGYFTLRGLVAHPDRFGRGVLLGFTGGAPMGHVPMVMKVATMPTLGRFLTRFKVNRRMARSMLRKIGLAQALDSGRLPEEGIAWFRSVLNDTDTMRNEIDDAPPLVIGLKGANRDLELPDDVLGRVQTPLLFLWGSEDPFGGEDVAQHFTARIPDAELEMVPKAGHAAWTDDPDLVTDRITTFFHPYH